MFFFPQANLIFASCLFERTMQTFLFARREGPFDLPKGMMFDGYKTVRIEHHESQQQQEQEDENEGSDDAKNESNNWERVGIPLALEEEAKSMMEQKKKIKKGGK